MTDIVLQLKRWRSKRDLTQQDIANKLQTCLATVNNWERGVSRPSKRLQRDIIKMFNNQLGD